MKPDPPVRRDRTCHVCHQPLRTSVPKGSKLQLSELQADPFCSTDCCRTHHNCQLGNTGPSRTPPPQSRELAARTYAARQRGDA